MNDPVIKRIKDKWLDCKKLSERDEALLFARIEKLEDELAARQGVHPTVLTHCPECGCYQIADHTPTCSHYVPHSG